MRAANITFQGDAFTLRAAQTQIRTQFRQKLQTLDPADSDGIKAALTQAEEVARFLRENVVQGKRVEGTDESYSMPASTPCHHLQLSPLTNISMQSCAYMSIRSAETTSPSRRLDQGILPLEGAGADDELMVRVIIEKCKTIL
jgi:hypothetical protein